MAQRDLYVGLMSGTSLDGVDAVVADFGQRIPGVLSHAHIAFDARLRESLLALTLPGTDEIERAGRLGNELADVYAQAVQTALARASIAPARIRAVGCHGQTIRHRPEEGFTRNWPQVMEKHTATKARVDSMWTSLGLGAPGKRRFQEVSEHRMRLAQM